MQIIYVSDVYSLKKNVNIPAYSSNDSWLYNKWRICITMCKRNGTLVENMTAWGWYFQSEWTSSQFTVISWDSSCYHKSCSESTLNKFYNWHSKTRNFESCSTNVNSIHAAISKLATTVWLYDMNEKKTNIFSTTSKN